MLLDAVSMSLDYAPFTLRKILWRRVKINITFSNVTAMCKTRRQTWLVISAWQNNGVGSVMDFKGLWLLSKPVDRNTSSWFSILRGFFFYPTRSYSSNQPAPDSRVRSDAQGLPRVKAQPFNLSALVLKKKTNSIKSRESENRWESAAILSRTHKYVAGTTAESRTIPATEMMKRTSLSAG